MTEGQSFILAMIFLACHYIGYIHGCTVSLGAGYAALLIIVGCTFLYNIIAHLIRKEINRIGPIGG